MSISSSHLEKVYETIFGIGLCFYNNYELFFSTKTVILKNFSGKRLSSYFSISSSDICKLFFQRFVEVCPSVKFTRNESFKVNWDEFENLYISKPSSLINKGHYFPSIKNLVYQQRALCSRKKNRCEKIDGGFLRNLDYKSICN